MIVKNNKDIIDSFKSARRTTEASKRPSRMPARKSPVTNIYQAFLNKYNNIEETIDTFGTRDLVYYFREVSMECEHKYVVSNIKKDMAIFKRLQENYSSREICGMIEFLFISEQVYLFKNRLSRNVLARSCVNTMYADTQLWLDDKYYPNSAKKSKKQREWSESRTEDVEIGGWE